MAKSPKRPLPGISRGGTKAPVEQLLGKVFAPKGARTPPRAARPGEPASAACPGPSASRARPATRPCPSPSGRTSCRLSPASRGGRCRRVEH